MDAPPEINPGDANAAAVWGAQRQRAGAGWMALMAAPVAHVPVGTQHAELKLQRAYAAADEADAVERLRLAFRAGLNEAAEG